MTRWLRAELRVFAAIHAALGLVIAFAPADLVITGGSIEAFRVLPHVVPMESARILWALAFVAVSVLVGTLSRRRSLRLQHVTWIEVVSVDTIWAGAFAAPLINGQGSAIAGVLCFLPVLWAFFLLARVARVARHAGDECG